MSYAETMSPQAVAAVSALVLRSMEHKSYSVAVFEADNTVARVIEATAASWVSYSTTGIRFQSDKYILLTVAPDALLFRQLVSQWRTERGATSSVTKMAMCPAYQRIIAMGPRAIPLILREMESEGAEPDMWFWALQMLADTDPVDLDDRGDMKRMAEAWINWGRQQGYAW